MARKYFGTDGIRGRVGQPPMTVDFIMKLGWAAGRVLSRRGRGKVVIGKDTRVSGYMFESALEAGLAAAGLDVMLLGPMPTPAIAYITQAQRATAGIVISASHNPFYDDGVKFFNGDGFKLPDSTEEEIEAMIEQDLEMVGPEAIGKASRMEDAKGRYIEFCKSSIAFKTSLRGMKLVVDCANGATYHIAPSVFRELGAEVIEIGTRPNGLNINQEVGALHPLNMRSQVLENQADLGIAFDGDGDRVMMMDSTGEIINGDQLLYIITMGKRATGQLDGGVVGTLMTNLGLEHALEARSIPFQRAAVGDRYVMAKLVEYGWYLGGESSGHIICLDKSTTGDGIIAALQVLECLVVNQLSLADACKDMAIYPQTMINVEISRPLDLDSDQNVCDAVKAAEAQLGDAGRVLLRPSGTEPLIRVMVEGQDPGQVENVAAELAQCVEQAAAGQTGV
ncbi:MAG: phosphoglucosamine mutase [Gammaproteobacteria bacterium]|jgi:phosphoglucosamine mutase